MRKREKEKGGIKKKKKKKRKGRRLEDDVFQEGKPRLEEFEVVCDDGTDCGYSTRYVGEGCFLKSIQTIDSLTPINFTIFN